MFIVTLKETTIPQTFLHFTQQQCASSVDIHEYFCMKNPTFCNFQEIKDDQKQPYPICEQNGHGLPSVYILITSFICDTNLK